MIAFSIFIASKIKTGMSIDKESQFARVSNSRAAKRRILDQIMRKKTSLVVAFIIVGLIISLPAIQSGKASFSAPEPDELGAISPSPAPAMPVAVKIETASETASPISKKTEKPPASPAPRKEKPIAKPSKQADPSPAAVRPLTESQAQAIAPLTVPVTPDVPRNKYFSCEIISDFREQFLCFINEHRLKNNRTALEYENRLSAVARAHSAWMTESGVTSHIGEGGSKFNERCVREFTVCFAENIVKGFTSASHLFELWKSSPAHNATMLGAYSMVGLGVYGDHATTLFR
jgi:uncharacterized protein YkwD